MKFLLIAIVSLLAGSAYAADPPKAPPVDFRQAVTDPLSKPLRSCADEKNPDCATTLLGAMVYTALSAPPRDQHGQPEQGSPQDAALGWKIMAATEPLYITEAEKARIVSSMRRAFSPGSAYAACRLIINPDDCEKP